MVEPQSRWILAFRYGYRQSEQKKADETKPLKGFRFVGLLDNWFLGVTPLNRSHSLPNIFYFDGSRIDDLCRLLPYDTIKRTETGRILNIFLISL